MSIWSVLWGLCSAVNAVPNFGGELEPQLAEAYRSISCWWIVPFFTRNPNEPSTTWQIFCRYHFQSINVPMSLGVDFFQNFSSCICDLILAGSGESPASSCCWPQQQRPGQRVYRSGAVAESTRSSAAIVVSVGQVCWDVGTKGSGCSALFQRIYVGHSSRIDVIWVKSLET